MATAALGYEEFKLHIDEILDPALGVPADRFERAVEEVGKALESQRPQKEFKEGPASLGITSGRVHS